MIALTGARVTVMGLGRFGGGVGVTRWLARQGARVLVTDLEPRERLAEPLEAIADLSSAGQVSLRLGEHRDEDFSEADLVVANPAVPRPWENQHLSAARGAGVPITTEIGLTIDALASRVDRSRIIGVTGSVGKSTTSAMIDRAIRGAGEACVLGGNIGGSLLERLDEIGAESWAVLELSSAMLHWLEGWSPAIAVVTNLAPNHADWHGTLEHYRRSKERILASQRPGDAAVLGWVVRDWATRPGVRRIVAESHEQVSGLRVPGLHNRTNAALAARAARAALGDRADNARIHEALRSFEGLPHRLRFLGEREGVRFFDDSKATTPDATLLALGAFREGGELARVRLIAGGYDKGIDLSPLALAASELAGLYTIGATGEALAADAGRSGAHAISCGTLERAVRACAADSSPGDIVLLSPGCASWDQFTNYEARGREFARLTLPDGAMPRAAPVGQA